MRPSTISRTISQMTIVSRPSPCDELTLSLSNLSMSWSVSTRPWMTFKRTGTSRYDRKALYSGSRSGKDHINSGDSSLRGEMHELQSEGGESALETDMDPTSEILTRRRKRRPICFMISCRGIYRSRGSSRVSVFESEGTSSGEPSNPP